MNIKLKETPEQKELLKAMGSKNLSVSVPAQEAFAAFLPDVVNEVLKMAGTSSMIYEDLPFGEDEDPSFPLDLYYDKDVNTIQVWSQNQAGGLASSHVYGMQEMKFDTYPLDSAVEMSKKYARRARLDVVNAAISRLSETVLLKQEINAWVVIMKALAEASTNGLSHVISSATADVLQLDDFNKLLTRFKRIHTSFAKRTAAAIDGRLSDLVVSPEMTEQIRGFAYQPMNTRVGTTGADETSNTAVPLADATREQIFRNAGAQEIYNVTIHEINELGVNFPYNTLFDNAYSDSFNPATQEILVGFNLVGKKGFKRPVLREENSTISVQPDNQWYQNRVDKMGWFLHLEEGRCCLDGRKVLGLIV